MKRLQNESKFFVLLILIVFSLTTSLTACQKSAPHPTPSPLPNGWVNPSELSSETEEEFENEPDEKTSETLDTILEAQSAALEGTPEVSDSAAPFVEQFAEKSRPQDWIPWHLEYLMADLAISLGGWIGALIKKGTPAVTMLWRRQNVGTRENRPLQGSFSEGVFSVSETASPQAITQELEPLIRGSLATGQIKNEQKFRENAVKIATEFQEIMQLLNQSQKNTWWLSRLRLDFSVDGSGNITPYIGVGAGVKLRFEWHRMMRTAQTPSFFSQQVSQAAALNQTHFGVEQFGKKLVNFANVISEDILELSHDRDQIVGSGYQAYTYRVGLGVSYSGEIGIGKGSASLVGQLQFSRDVQRPVVQPKSIIAHSPETTPETITIVNDSAKSSITRLDRAHFRKGLRRALQMSRFFARHAAKISSHTRWKIYELRTSFDLSLGGRTGLSPVDGSATSQINFYNQNF